MYRNQQELFDQVVRHLLTQGSKSMDDEGCAYRGSEGRKCAVGFLIPDDKYSPSFEGISLVELASDKGSDSIKALRDVLKELHLLYPAQMQILIALQAVHDKHEPHSWPDRLVDVARLFDLSPYAVFEHAGKAI